MLQKNNKMLIESVREFMLTCPFLQNWQVNVDFLDVKMNYSIDPLPASPVVRKYTDGTAIKQFLFSFTSKEAYDGTARTGIENSGFYQCLEEWVEEKNRKKLFPNLGEKKIPIALETIQSGYLYDTGTDLGQYQIQFALKYEQEA